MIIAYCIREMSSFKSRCTSTALQEELRAILPVNPASVNFTLFSPRGIGIGLDMSSTGGRQTTFLL